VILETFTDSKIVVNDDNISIFSTVPFGAQALYEKFGDAAAISTPAETDVEIAFFCFDNYHSYDRRRCLVTPLSRSTSPGARTAGVKFWFLSYAKFLVLIQCVKLTKALRIHRKCLQRLL
jgi:hypothetical protein